MNTVNRTYRIFLVSALLGLAVGTAKAEFIGLNLGTSHWLPATTGSFDPDDSGSIGLIDDPNAINAEASSIAFTLEHPIPALPNLRFQGSRLNSDTNFQGGAFSSGNELSSAFDLSHDDIVLYYRLPSNRMTLDLGVDMKRLDGQVLFADETSNPIPVDETIALLHLSARFDLPLDGLYVGANLNTNVIDLGISESSANDSTIMLGYESGTGIGIVGGVKYLSLALENVDEPDTDLEYDSIFLNGYINF